MPFTRKCLLLRFPRNAEIQEIPIAALLSKLDSPVHTITAKGSLFWKDGLAIRFYSGQSPDQESRRLMSHLSKFDGWAIWDEGGSFSEPFDGTIGVYSRQSNCQLAQCSLIFLRYRRDDCDFEEMNDVVRKQIREKVGYAFRLRSGCVLITETPQTLHILFERFQSYKLRKYVDWTFAMRAGEEEGSLDVVWRRSSA